MRRAKIDTDSRVVRAVVCRSPRAVAALERLLPYSSFRLPQSLGSIPPRNNLHGFFVLGRLLPLPTESHVLTRAEACLLCCCCSLAYVPGFDVKELEERTPVSCQSSDRTTLNLKTACATNEAKLSPPTSAKRYRDDVPEPAVACSGRGLAVAPILHLINWSRSGG